MAEPENNAFLIHLAVKEKVIASTQNQALAALLFLYRHVIGREVGNLDKVIRTRKPKRLPIVLTRDAVKAVLGKLSRDEWLMASLMYGAGLRLMECLRLRVQDIDFSRNEILIRNEDGTPKDWDKTHTGGFRLTHPSNLWTDISVPFWSMPENTDHPTQKPEKLIAKLILASSNPGDVVLDPFLGSGMTSVVAKKLGRRYVGIEIDRTYCCLAEKRLARAEDDDAIQGYHDGVFWQRNSLAEQNKPATKKRAHVGQWRTWLSKIAMGFTTWWT